MKWFKRVLIFIAVIVFITVGFIFIFPGKAYNIFASLGRSKAGVILKEVSIGDHKIKYLESTSQGETVVLLHGYGAEKGHWLKMAALMKGYHLIIPDLPGLGDSTKSMSQRYDVESQVERMDKFLNVIGQKKFFIAGNSMGGNIAGFYAIRHPEKVKGLILLNNLGVNSPEKTAIMKAFEKGENPLLISSMDDYNIMMKSMFVKIPFTPYPIKKFMAEKAIKSREFNQKVFMDLITKPAMFEGHFSELTMPVLIIWGDKDQILDVSSVGVLEKGIKNHTTKILKDCGHVPMMERPEETALYIKQFIDANKRN